MNQLIKNQSSALKFGLVAVACWSTVATAFKIALQDLAPMSLLFISSLTAWLFLFLFLVIKGQLHQIKQVLESGKRSVIAAGLINPFFYYWVLFAAYDLLPAQQAQAINYTWAITLAVMSAWVFKQPLMRTDWIAITFGYLGVVLIASKGSLDFLTTTHWGGVGLALLSTLLWAAYWVINTKLTFPAVTTLFTCFSISMPFVFIAFLLDSNDNIWSVKAVGAAVYVGLFEMAVTFIFWLLALQKAERIAQVSNLIFLSPFVSLILIYFILGESLFWTTPIGLVMIVLGVYIQSRKAKST